MADNMAKQAAGTWSGLVVIAAAMGIGWAKTATEHICAALVVLVAAVLFLPSEIPYQRAKGLIREWRRRPSARGKGRR